MHPSAFGIVLLLGTVVPVQVQRTPQPHSMSPIFSANASTPPPPPTPFVANKPAQNSPLYRKHVPTISDDFQTFFFPRFPLLLGWVHQNLHRPFRSKAVLRGKHGKHILEKKLRSGYSEASHNRFVHKSTVPRTRNAPYVGMIFMTRFLPSPFHENNPVLPREGVRRVWKQASSTTTSDKIIIKNNLFIHRSIRRLGNGTENVK